jgi:hypothetical protein
MNDLTAFNYEVVTVASAGVATGLTKHKSNPNGGTPAKYAYVVVDTVGTIRYAFGGLTVGHGTGHFGTPTQIIELHGNQQILDFRTTSDNSAATAQISVSYFR